MQYELVIDVIAAVSCMGAISMAWWGYKKWDVARRERLAEFLFNIIQKLRDDKEIMDFIYFADWEHSGNEISEQQKDRALTYLSYVCYLASQNVITADEFAFFEYEINRVLKNKVVGEYLAFIKDFADLNGCDNPFCALLDYSENVKKEMKGERS